MEKEDALPLEIAARAFCRQDAEGTGVPKNKIQNYVDSNWERVHTEMMQRQFQHKTTK